MSVVSVLNYKGGVGKTTLTANIGAGVAARGGKVLLIDLDPQASLTFSFYRPREWEQQFSEHTVMQWYDSHSWSGKPRKLDEFLATPPQVNQVVKGRLDLIPSHLGLVDVELDLAAGLGGSRYQTFSPEYLKTYRLLADALAAQPFTDYDLVLIDCPPNFNMVTRTAVVASDHILVPAKADYLSTLGIAFLQRRVGRLVDEYEGVARSGVTDAINPVILGVVFTMVQYAGSGLMNKLSDYINRIRDLEVPIFDQKVRESKSVFADNAEHGVPAVVSAQTNPQVAYDLQQLVVEFLARTNVRSVS